MKQLLLCLVLTLILTSCTLTLKNERVPLGTKTQEASITIAPLISINKVDTLPSGEQHVQKFLGIAPVPTSEKKTTTEQKSETVTEVDTTKAN